MIGDILCFSKGTDIMDLVLGPPPSKTTMNPFYTCNLAFVDNEDGTFKVCKSRFAMAGGNNVDRREMLEIIKKHI